MKIKAIYEAVYGNHPVIIIGFNYVPFGKTGRNGFISVEAKPIIVNENGYMQCVALDELKIVDDDILKLFENREWHKETEGSVTI